MFRYGLVLGIGLWAATAAPAASWADALFDELSQDFGSVPRGPTITHQFHLTNRTRHEVRISGIRVSCGCVTATALQGTLAPGESTAIVAQMDTRRFNGAKTVTIYVQFDRPQWEEVRLWVQANSRDDVTVSPEVLAFGQIKRSTSGTASVTVTFQGGSDWQITEAKCESNYVRTRVSEVSRQAGEVAYEVLARIRPDAPVGKWYTEVWLTTNSSTIPRVRVPLTVEVESALSVSPPVAVLGDVKAGTETERKVIVRGVKPFRITGVKGAGRDLTIRDSSPASKPVHVLTVTLRATEPGELNRTLRIVTDLPEDSEIEFQTIGQIVP
jgi:hypothetical protein